MQSLGCLFLYSTVFTLLPGGGDPSYPQILEPTSVHKVDIDDELAEAGRIPCCSLLAASVQLLSDPESQGGRADRAAPPGTLRAAITLDHSSRLDTASVLLPAHRWQLVQEKPKQQGPVSRSSTSFCRETSTPAHTSLACAGVEEWATYGPVSHNFSSHSLNAGASALKYCERHFGEAWLEHWLHRAIPPVLRPVQHALQVPAAPAGDTTVMGTLAAHMSMSNRRRS